MPAGFGRLIRSGQGPLLKASAKGVAEAVPQLGDYDPNILCEACDNILGGNDEYAVNVCKDFKARIGDAEGAYFELDGVDCDRFSKFVLSVIWRASISNRGTFSDVIPLGPYYEVTRAIVFGSQPISDLPQFELVVSRLRHQGADVSGINIYPIRFRFERLNAYSLVLGGFRILAKFEKRMLHRKFADLIINRTGIFRGVFLEFGECQEIRGLAGIFAANKNLTESPASVAQ